MTQERHVFKGHKVYLHPLTGKYIVSWKGVKEAECDSIDEVKAFIKRINKVTTRNNGKGYQPNTSCIGYPKPLFSIVF